MNDHEIRYGAELSIEARADEKHLKIAGHAAVFDVEADIGGMFRERIVRGAFSEAIGRDDVRLLIEHEGLPLARTKSGSLFLSEDSRGLRIEADLNLSDPDVARLKPKLERGDLSNMSIGFSMRGGRQVFEEEDGKQTLRIIEKIGELFDVSLVTFPAFATTDVALRSMKSASRALQKTRTIRAMMNRQRKLREMTCNFR
jgi:hypothetical protein